jgi:Zn finger protein HypA/HybF involved in hydrogenase expression
MAASDGGLVEVRCRECDARFWVEAGDASLVRYCPRCRGRKLEAGA